jgi:hypothetical protein
MLSAQDERGIVGVDPPRWRRVFSGGLRQIHFAAGY